MKRFVKHGIGMLAVLLLGAVPTVWSARPADDAGCAEDIRRLTIVQWNVENLFDHEDDPHNKGDDPFTPRGWQHWSERRYRIKLMHLAEVLAKLDGDIVCVEEIENKRVLDDLAEVLRSQHKLDYPFIVHREGPDHRGIDVALLSRARPVKTRWITPVEKQRDVLIADFVAGGKSFVIFVNHWKSRWGSQERSTRLRTAQAAAVRKEIDRLLEADPGSAVILAGDFNDNFDDPVVKDVVRSSSDRKRVLLESDAGWMYNLHAELKEELRGTFYYRREKTWNSFDTISVSRGMLCGSGDDSGWKVDPPSYEVFRARPVVDPKGRPLPFRYLTNEETGKREYLTGYSDHLPVRVAISLGHAAASREGAAASDRDGREQ